MLTEKERKELRSMIRAELESVMVKKRDAPFRGVDGKLYHWEREGINLKGSSLRARSQSKQDSPENK